MVTRLEHWSLSKNGSGNIYTAPELKPVTLSGIVYNHPVKADGTQVDTSALKDLVFEGGCGKATTLNRIYELGEMAEGYKDFRQAKGLRVDTVRFVSDS